jgi:hypothetical protein
MIGVRLLYGDVCSLIEIFEAQAVRIRHHTNEVEARFRGDDYVAG